MVLAAWKWWWLKEDDDQKSLVLKKQKCFLWLNLKVINLKLIRKTFLPLRCPAILKTFCSSQVQRHSDDLSASSQHVSYMLYFYTEWMKEGLETAKKGQSNTHSVTYTELETESATWGLMWKKERGKERKEKEWIWKRKCCLHSQTTASSTSHPELPLRRLLQMLRYG